MNQAPVSCGCEAADAAFGVASTLPVNAAAIANAVATLTSRTLNCCISILPMPASAGLLGRSAAASVTQTRVVVARALRGVHQVIRRLLRRGRPIGTCPY